MRVLLVTQYFYPEQFKSNDIAFELAKKGYQVDVLTGIPNYPEGRYYQGYGLCRRRHEVINGVNVYRAFQFPRGKGGWRLSLNYFSYVVQERSSVLSEKDYIHPLSRSMQPKLVAVRSKGYFYNSYFYGKI